MQTAAVIRTVETADATSGIDRRPGLSYADFARTYLRPLRPVVVPAATRDWPATGRWTPRFFAERYPEKELTINGRTFALPEFIDLVERSDGRDATPYLFALLLDEHFPDLMADVLPPSPYAAPSWLERRFLPGGVGRRLYNDRRYGLFIGGRGAGATLHYDFGYHSLSFQFHGEKKFYLYPPGQTPLMYARPDLRNVSEVGYADAADLAKFPRFAEARPAECVIGPGDLLFIPGGWWHGTRVLSPSVSLSVNTANAANWHLVVRDLGGKLRRKHPLLAAAFAAALRVVGGCKALKDRLTGP